MKRTPEYAAYMDMLRRCYNPKNRRYGDYGGRGIKVCREWRQSFAAFLRDMGNRPDGLSLDREDNDGDYDPGNCRWANRSQQQRNKRTSPIVLTPEGDMVLADALEKFGIHPQTYYRRKRAGWPLDKMFELPRRKTIVTTPRGDMTVGDAIRVFGLHPQTYYRRVKLGWSGDRLFDPPTK